MPAKGIVLSNSGIVGPNSSTVAASTWDGGRTVCTVDCGAFGTGVALQFQGPNQSWIPIASSFVANQAFPFDAPAGQYRLVVTSGIATAAYINLVSVPYTG